MKQELIPYGSDIKILVDVTNLDDGVELGDIAYSLEFTGGEKTKLFEVTVDEGEQSLPTGLTVVDDHRVAASIKGGVLDRGDVWLRITLEIPDESFTDGVRVEIRDIDVHITIF